MGIQVLGGGVGGGVLEKQSSGTKKPVTVQGRHWLEKRERGKYNLLQIKDLTAIWHGFELPSFRASELPSFRASELPSFRASELPSFRAALIISRREASACSRKGRERRRRKSAKVGIGVSIAAGGRGRTGGRIYLDCKWLNPFFSKLLGNVRYGIVQDSFCVRRRWGTKDVLQNSPRRIHLRKAGGT